MYFEITNALVDKFSHGKGFIADHIRQGHADIVKVFHAAVSGFVGGVSTFDPPLSTLNEVWSFQSPLGLEFIYKDGSPDLGKIPLNHFTALDIVIPVPTGVDKPVVKMQDVSMSFSSFLSKAAAGTLDAFLLGGNDTLIDNKYGHTIKGYGGNDTIKGNSGNDTIVGGFGHDTLSGGGGTDNFIYKSATESGPGPDKRDIITDFKHGIDKIDLGAILSSPFHFKGLQPLKGLGDIHYGYDHTATVVTISTDSDAAPEMELYLNGHVALTASDFIL
jgi:RTX calcium-binding nonapeptide repeat (4 copies)